MSQRLHDLQHVVGWLIDFANGKTQYFPDELPRPQLPGLQQSRVDALEPKILKEIVQGWYMRHRGALEALRAADVDGGKRADMYWQQFMPRIMVELVRGIGVASKSQRVLR